MFIVTRRFWRILMAVGVFLLVSSAVPNVSYANGNMPGTFVLRRVHVPILMYHYISVPPADSDKYRVDLSVSPDNFRQQMTWLKQKGYTTITPDDLYEALRHGRKLPDLPVLLTFDDGYEDAYTNALPILSEFGFIGTFNIVTGWLDEGKDGYLSWPQVNEMAQKGMAIQSHSRQHNDMRNRDHDWLVYQILGPEESIEAHTGVRPRFFTYPSGQYDDTVLRELDGAGVLAAFTENDGVFAYSDNMLRLPRVRIRGSTSLESFAYLMTWQR